MLNPCCDTVSAVLRRGRDFARPRGMHLFIHDDGKGSHGWQAESWLDSAYFAEPAADHRADGIQPLDWQLRRIYSRYPPHAGGGAS